MKTTKYHRLPQPRVDQETYEGIHAIAQAQEMSIAEVIRAALKEYVQPPAIDSVPIVGVLKDGKILLYRQNGDREISGHVEDSPHITTFGKLEIGQEFSRIDDKDRVIFTKIPLAEIDNLGWVNAREIYTETRRHFYDDVEVYLVNNRPSYTKYLEVEHYPPSTPSIS